MVSWPLIPRHQRLLKTDIEHNSYHYDLDDICNITLWFSIQKITCCRDNHRSDHLLQNLGVQMYVAVLQKHLVIVK